MANENIAVCSNDDHYILNDGLKHPKIGFGTYKVGFIPASASGIAALYCSFRENSFDLLFE